MRTEMIAHLEPPPSLTSRRSLVLAMTFSGFLAKAVAETAGFLVLERGTGTLSYYSSDGQRKSSVAIGGKPREMVRSPDGRFLYITVSGTNAVTIVDIAARRKFAEIALGQYQSPQGIDLDPVSGLLAVTTESPDQLLLIDPAKRSVLKHFATKAAAAGMVKFGPGGLFAYVSNSGSSNISALRLATGEVKLIPTQPGPAGGVLSKDGKELYVCNAGAPAITVIDTNRQSAIANIITSSGPVRVALTPDGNTLIYALMDEKKVGIANPRRRAQVDYVLLPHKPISLDLSPGGDRAFASVDETDVTYVISIAQKRIVQDIQGPAGSAPGPVFETAVK